MAAALVVGPADSIRGVIERMRAIDTHLPEDDGVAYFNRMYLRVTEDVGHAVDRHAFEAKAFLDQLDVRFANLFFAAFDADARGETGPSAWAPLFSCRIKPATHPIQFAFAGMNAHINHDLGIAVVETCQQLGVVPDDGTPEHHDFVATNAILDARIPAIKQWFAGSLVNRVDVAAGKIDDAFERWGIAVLRDSAWDVGKLLWLLRDHPLARRVFLATLARTVEAAGHGILI